MTEPTLANAIEKMRAEVREQRQSHPNRPDTPPDYVALLDDIDQTATDVGQEFARNLTIIERRIRGLRIDTTGAFEVDRLDYGLLRLRRAVETARLAAVAAGYPEAEEIDGPGQSIEVARASVQGEIDALTVEIRAMREELSDLAERAEREEGPRQQSRLIQLNVNRARLKLNLVELNIGDRIDLAGLLEAVTGLLRVVRSFVKTVIAPVARVAAWVKEAAVRLSRRAGALGKATEKASAAARRRSPGPPAVDLATLKEQIAAGIAPPAAVAERFIELSLSGMRMRTLSGLHNLSGLQSLDLSHTQVADLTPLSGLTGLQLLDLSSTQVADLTPLSGLTGLQSLYLRYTRIADLTPLSRLSGLQSLDLRYTQVADLTPLSGLTSLQSLYLSSTQVADLTPLLGLKALTRIVLHDNKRAIALASASDSAFEVSPDGGNLARKGS